MIVPCPWGGGSFCHPSPKGLPWIALHGHRLSLQEAESEMGLCVQEAYGEWVRGHTCEGSWIVMQSQSRPQLAPWGAPGRPCRAVLSYGQRADHDLG